MARHTPSGRLVAVKNTNLDECTEEELLQLMKVYTRGRQWGKVAAARKGSEQSPGWKETSGIPILRVCTSCLDFTLLH
ncbi:hypothetical protein HF521_000887 [Silurus meridionalis]|uniref:Uncharacterized protein n=1 Tax=Silurus meridionalis TaxID=175797 RepID=A0A8T0C0J8_SILME|nr:hypothetical protein HF521_000887 [Silurus meridionalis]